LKEVEEVLAKIEDDGPRAPELPHSASASSGVLATCSVDLVLEPLAYYTGIWIWLEPYILQIYFGSTVANALVWAGMCLIGIKLWEAHTDV
jgi:uncharacterized membrane protein